LLSFRHSGFSNHAQAVLLPNEKHQQKTTGTFNGGKMMEFNNLGFEQEGGIAVVTIERPEVLNALNNETIFELGELFSSIKTNEEIRGVILTGSGNKAFVAGADIKELAVLNPLKAKQIARQGQEVLSRIECLTKPVIAAVNGFALGGGCELALACHMRIATENARFGQPEVNLGLIPGFGGTQRLPRLVGKGAAIEMVLSGGIIDAEEAYRIGLVNKIVPEHALLASAKKLLSTILSKVSVAVELSIVAINHGLEMPLDDGLRLESVLFGLTCSTEDMKEGTSAFLEKRKPEFRGK